MVLRALFIFSRAVPPSSKHQKPASGMFLFWTAELPLTGCLHEAQSLFMAGFPLPLHRQRGSPGPTAGPALAQRHKTKTAAHPRHFPSYVARCIIITIRSARIEVGHVGMGQVPGSQQ